MILNETPEQKAVLSNVDDVGEFRIRNSAKAFDILSSGLYSNKIRAIIRELSTNAYDSHVAAGVGDRPFDVHLPTEFEPWFSIRDYGVGLDHNEVVNIYTTYFESTKTESNDFVGALGLGSKSPFSYTKNFMVVAIKHGTKSSYAAFINDNGVPSIAVLGRTETNEPNGVEIKIAVDNPRDFYNFKDESRYVYRYFDTAPNFTGAKVEIERPKYISDIATDTIKFRSDRCGTPRAIMGNIAYDIEVPNQEQNLGEKLANLLSLEIDIYFNIGDVDFQASREGLSYTKHTIASIKQKLEEIYPVVESSFMASVQEKRRDYWEFSKWLSSRTYSRIYQSLVHDFLSKYPVYEQNSRYSQRYVHEKAYPGVLRIKPLQAKFGDTTEVFSVGYQYNKNVLRRDKNADWVNVRDRPVLVVCNKIRGNMAYVSDCVRRKLGPFKGVNFDTLVIVEATEGKKLRKLCKYLHKPKVVTLEELLVAAPKVKPPKVVRKAIAPDGTPEEVPVRVYNKNSECLETECFAELLESTDTKYYIPVKGSTYDGTVDALKGTFCSDLGKMVMPILPSGVTRIHFLRKTVQKAVHGKANWVNVDDYILDWRKTPAEKVLLPVWDTVGSNRITSMPYVNYHVDSTYVQQIKNIDLQKIFQRESISNRRYPHIILTLYAPTDAQFAEVELEVKRLQAVWDRYPLLKSLGRYTDADTINQYVEMVDKYNEMLQNQDINN